MKLFTTYNRILLVVSLLGLLVIGFLFYRTLKYYLDRQIDDSLLEELMEVQDYTHVKNIAPAPAYFQDIVIEYHKTNKANSRKIFSDTTFINPKKKREETARYLRANIDLNGQPLQVLIMISKDQREEQIRNIFLIIIIPVCLLMIVLFMVNRILMKRIWRPFEQMLANIKAFNVNHEKPFDPVETPIQEFRELNVAVSDMALKVRSDFKEIKLFTENASHEMMTPLAVINSKLDTMLQSNLMGKEESETLTDLYKATSKLTKLNQSLLLLVKIDNEAVLDQEEVDVKDVLEEKLLYFQELIQKRELKVYKELSPLVLVASRQLLEIMINNLFSNTIRHNYDGGEIYIKLKGSNLSFSNSSHNRSLDPDKVFERFHKDAASEGTGLGLAILRQVCNRQHYQLNYSYRSDQHLFQVTFN